MDFQDYIYGRWCWHALPDTSSQHTPQDRVHCLRSHRSTAGSTLPSNYLSCTPLNMKRKENAPIRAFNGSDGRLAVEGRRLTRIIGVQLTLALISQISKFNIIRVGSQGITDHTGVLSCGQTLNAHSRNLHVAN